MEKKINWLRLFLWALAIGSGFGFCLTLCQRTEKTVHFDQYYDKYCDQCKLTEAYSKLLHRVWIDNPSYVEDVLTETDEFCALDSLKGGDFEDIFFFWSIEDSIAYYNNMWYQSEMPNQVPHDKTSQKVQQINTTNLW